MDNGVHGPHGMVAAPPVEEETRSDTECATAQLQPMAVPAVQDQILKARAAIQELVSENDFANVFGASYPTPNY